MNDKLQKLSQSLAPPEPPHSAGTPASGGEVTVPFQRFPAEEPESRGEFSLRDYWRTLHARRWTILSTAAAAVVLAAIYNYIQVSRIRWSARGVAADTSAGAFTARVAIVALPSAVIADGAVVFAPHLPVEVLQAHHDLPLGLLDKVALKFKRNVFPSERSELLVQRRNAGRGMNFLTRHWDSNTCIGLYGGRFAHEMEAAGEAAAIEHALAELTTMLGGEVRRHFDRGVATAWAADPFARGSYSHCLPGRFGARAMLTRPVGGRLVFAGEHTEQAHYGTLHGAHLSGKRAAGEARRLLAEFRA
jgi:monoamine oxidase